MNQTITLKSAIPFRDSHTGEPVDALDTATLTVSSRELGWPGLLVEAGWKDSWAVDDLTIAHHYLALNLADAPLVLDVKKPTGFYAVTLDPGSIWLCPAGEPFSHRVRGRSSFALAAIEPPYFDHLFDEEKHPPELHRDYNIALPQIEHVVKALVVEADRGNPGGVPFVEALTAALSVQLARHAGVRTTPSAASGGLSAPAKRRALELIDARLGHGISIADLARETGLSPTHFARAFKKSLGRAPHQYIMMQRLDRARRLLEVKGAVISDVALRTGFADQSHFTRLFTRRFGITPGALMRARSR